MFKWFFKEVENLEEMLVECSEMAHFSAGINKMLRRENEAYIEQKNTYDENNQVDIVSCEMYRYLSTT